MSAELSVFFIENADSSRSAMYKSFSIASLPHPRDGPSLFLLHAGNIYEYQKATPRKLGCFFIDQRISSSPTICVATCVDPRFLVLPFLEANAKGRYSPLDQIITHVEGTQRIPLENISKWKMHECCDVNDKFGDDMILYRYNEEKTVQWLRSKLMRAAAVLRTKRMQRSKTENKASVDTFNLAAQGEGCIIPPDGTTDTGNDACVLYSLS
jgi:ribonuclease H2 subunit B